MATQSIALYCSLGDTFRGYTGVLRGVLGYIPKYKKRGRESSSFFHNDKELLFCNPLFLWEHDYFLIETLARPLRRRAWVTFLPPGVFERTRKPCVLALFRLLGWYVCDIRKIYTKTHYFAMSGNTGTYPHVINMLIQI